MTSTNGPLRPQIPLILIVSIVMLLIHYENLVACVDLSDDSLENALEAIERRQRALQNQEHYGQPENIGYGFQKNFGFFDSPARHLGAVDFWPKHEQNERSVFRERASPNRPTSSSSGSQKDDYLQLVSSIWDRYQQEHPAYTDIEDLSDDQIAAILTTLRNQDNSNQGNYLQRDQRSYRIFDSRSKRLPWRRINNNAQRLDASLSSAADPFLYSLKWVNPSNNRDAVELLDPVPDTFFDDDTRSDPDVGVVNRGGDDYPIFVEEEKRNIQPKIFRQHNNLLLNRPVKRNAKLSRVRKNTNEQEVKDIFSKKSSANKKEDVSKKDKDEKKTKNKKVVVRRADPSAETNQPDAQLTKLFHVNKKNIDWSNYFGVDKRGGMYENPFDTRVFNTKRNFNDNNENVDTSLDAMESKLSEAEEKLIEDTIRYIGAHTDTGYDGETADEITDEVHRRLGAAYSVEKIKHALEEFRRSVGVAAPPHSSVPGQPSPPYGEATTTVVATPPVKRVANKKDGVDNASSVEFINKETDNDGHQQECELLNRLMANCMRVDEILGPFSDLLTPTCTLYEICYTCGPEIGVKHRSVCDLMYINESNHLCQGQPECISAARESVLALREINSEPPANNICHANPCVADHFLLSPSGVVPINN